MAIPQIIDQLINLLERQRFHGINHIEISCENYAFLFETKKHKPVPPGKSPITRRNVTDKKVTNQAELNPKKHFNRNSSRQNFSENKEVREFHFCESPSSGLNVTISELEEMVSECTKCGLCNTRKQTVFGCGSTHGQVMFIGDRPSQEDDANGTPFSDKMGNLLDKIITAMQLLREQVYITNMVKCFPPGKRLADDNEVLACLPYIQRQIEIVKPRVIILLGAVPLKYLFNKKGIVEHRGQWLKYNNIDCMPTYHPSYLFRVPKAKREVWNDMQSVMKRLNLAPR